MSQKEPPYGLSKVVTLAVLPRLYMEELVLELGRRCIDAQTSSSREDLIDTLADVIMREFCGLTTGSVEDSSNNEQPSESREADSGSCGNSTLTTEVLNSRMRTPSTVSHVSSTHKRKRREKETATSSGVSITPPRRSQEGTEEPRNKKQQTDKHCSTAVTSTDYEEPTQTNLSRQLGKEGVENESAQLESSPSSDVVIVKVEPALDRENEGQMLWRDFRETTEAVHVQDQADVGSDYLARMEECTMQQGVGRRYGDVHGGLGNTGEAVSEWCVEQNHVIVDGGVAMEMGQGLLNQQQEMEMSGDASCSTGKLHRCPHCSYTTTWSSVLTRHLRTHTGEKPFKCPDCDYSASQKGTLDRHLAVHSGERPFVCVECGYRAVDKSRLTRHYKSHSLNKLFVCELCGFSTQDGSLLVAHEATHTTHPADPGGNPC
ncbi:uncharacterized protein LOC144865830 isoform X1 [Branchiostoma floridae x Branchiostoma japonicum]